MVQKKFAASRQEKYQNIEISNAGEEIAFRWAVVIRGGKKPLFVKLTSCQPDGFGERPSPIIPKLLRI